MKLYGLVFSEGERSFCIGKNADVEHHIASYRCFYCKERKDVVVLENMSLNQPLELIHLDNL